MTVEHRFGIEFAECSLIYLAKTKSEICICGWQVFLKKNYALMCASDEFDASI